MVTAPDFSAAWNRLDPGFRAALTQAWESLRGRGLPVGAVLSLDGEIVAHGRNRVYDERGGDDPLQRTPLAHAEMNALASVPEEVDLAGAELWTTQEPCSMCRAAIEFTGVGAVRYLATDPSAEEASEGFVSSADSDEIWIVVANGLFLHNIAWVSGADNPMLDRNQCREPEIVGLARDLVAQRTLITPAEAGLTLEQALPEAWNQISDVLAARGQRPPLSG